MFTIELLFVLESKIPLSIISVDICFFVLLRVCMLAKCVHVS